jgi:hypothetical protein
VTLEEKLAGWIGPSSDTEQEKQERTVRMIREAIQAHEPFKGCSLSVYAKGSYPNNTNVRQESDVDVAVQCNDVTYWEEAAPGAHAPSVSYSGPWTPSALRQEVVTALKANFAGQIDTSGSTAVKIASASSRVNADVTPGFNYRYYFADGRYREGTRIVRTDGVHVNNYPDQHLANGRAKNNRTSTNFKRVVRIMKRVEYSMVADGYHDEVPSFFIECLAYNCPDTVFTRSDWTSRVKGVLATVYEALDGPEPEDASERWLQVDECLYLFSPRQKWTREMGRSYAYAAWRYLGLGSS